MFKKIADLWKGYKSVQVSQKNLLNNLDKRKQILNRHVDNQKLLRTKLSEMEAATLIHLTSALKLANSDQDKLAEWNKLVTKDLPTDNQVAEMMNNLINTYKRDEIVKDLQLKGLDTSLVDKPSISHLDINSAKALSQYLLFKSIESNEKSSSKLPIADASGNPLDIQTKIKEINAVKDEIADLQNKTKQELEEVSKELTDEERKILEKVKTSI